MKETATPRELIRKYGVRPRKRLGQNFLTDVRTIDRIVGTAAITGGDTVVEIGAGLGVLTARIAGRAGRVVALEIDEDMVSILRRELSGFENVSIVQADVLRYDFSAPLREDGSVPGPGKLKVVGNVPYGISSPILFHLLEYRRHIDSMTLMFQKEVAERIVAIPGTKAYGTLSVMFAMYFETIKAFNVPAECFHPRPGVDSAVVRMTPRERPVIALKSDSLFRQVVRAAFAQRRKTLVNNLRASPLWPPSREEDLSGVLDRLGIDGRRRGETLSAEEFGRLSNELFSFNKTLDREDLF